MKAMKHWFVCLDLSKIDDIIIGYLEFLSEIYTPATISFLHVIESDELKEDLSELFPEVDRDTAVEETIRNDFNERIGSSFEGTDIETRMIIKQGRPVDEIIQLLSAMDPDLLVMGNKSGYTGEGIMPKRILKYVPSSILFIPETCRYSLDRMLVLTDFSEASARGITLAESLSESGAGDIVAQHIYRYPSHFFPYMPTEGDQEKLQRWAANKESAFREDMGVRKDLPITLTLHREGTLAESVYDEVVRSKADMIITVSKSDKKISSLLRRNFNDRIVNYSFGVPLLIYKNKKKHRKYLDSLLA